MKVKRLKGLLSTAEAELYSFMKCFGSCQLLSEIWMGISGEAANIHMRTDAENLVTTARTIHLHKRKETIHMISTLRKEACSGNIHDLACIPTQNCLADCLTRASAKADKLITAVKTRPSCLPGAEHLRVSLAPTSREGPFHVMFVRSQHNEEQKNLNMCKGGERTFAFAFHASISL